MKIILGTAHGSNVAGKRSPDGRLREYQYSREIVGRVEKALLAEGYDVVVDLRQDYEPSLAFRVRVVNNLCDQYGTKNCFYVSIHVNAAGMGEWKNASFWTVWTSRGQTRGDVLANCLYNAACDVLRPMGKSVKGEWSDGDADYEANFYVLKHTKCAAALTENFFQDCRKDVDWLLSEEGKQAIVDVHVQGIQNYINKVSL